MAKDFRNKTFQRVLRGYAPEEVNDYLAFITEEYKKLERRNSDNERKLMIALAKLDEMNTLILEMGISVDGNVDEKEPQTDTSRDVEKQATMNANRITTEATVTAGRIVREAKEEAAENTKKAQAMYRAASEMFAEICAFREEMFGLYTDHIESIEEMFAVAERHMNGIDEGYVPTEAEEAAEDVVGSDEFDEEIVTKNAEALEEVEELEEIEADEEVEDETMVEDDLLDGVLPEKEEEYLEEITESNGEEYVENSWADPELFEEYTEENLQDEYAEEQSEEYSEEIAVESEEGYSDEQYVEQYEEE